MTSFTFRSKADLVADAIRELINQGDVGPGSVLRQRDLAERFEVSPTPVREALRRLEAEGLVVNEVHRGATVVRPTDENKAEIYGIRAALESHAAWLACERATPDDLTTAARLHEQIAALEPDDPQIVELNRQFHRCIYEASRSTLLISLIRQTWSAISGGPQVIWRPHDESVAQHAAMVQALHDRDGARLAELTRVHIEGAIGHMQKALETDRSTAPWTPPARPSDDGRPARSSAGPATDTTTPVVRDAEHDDVAAICRFGEAHIRPHYAPLIGARAADEQVRRWWNETHVGAAVAGGLVVVADADGQLVGVGQRGRTGVDHVVYKLYVHPQHRGRGLGPRLLDALTRQLPADADRLYIEHFAANERAGAFYEREGFTVERIESSPTEDPALGVVWRARQLAPPERTSGQA